MLFTSLVCATTSRLPHFCLTVGVRDERGSAGSRPLVPALFASGMACSSSERTGSQTLSKTPEQHARHRSHIWQLDERARSATAPAVRLAVRIGVATGLVVQGQQEEGTRGTLAAASCARVSITQVATCFRPRDLCGSGEGHESLPARVKGTGTMELPLIRGLPLRGALPAHHEAQHRCHGSPACLWPEVSTSPRCETRCCWCESGCDDTQIQPQRSL